MSGQDRDRSRKKSLGCSIIDDLSWGIDNPPISEIPNKQTGGALPISTKKCIDCIKSVWQMKIYHTLFY